MKLFHAPKPYASKDDRNSGQIAAPICWLLFLLCYLAGNFWMLRASAVTVGNQIGGGLALLILSPILQAAVQTLLFELYSRILFHFSNIFSRGGMGMYFYEFNYPFRWFVMVRWGICALLQLVLVFFPLAAIYVYAAGFLVALVVYGGFCYWFLKHKIAAEKRANVFLPMAVIYLMFSFFRFMGGLSL